DDLARVIVPVGGGGLASGLAIAIKSVRPEVEVVGVQVDTMAVYREALRDGTPGHVERALTIADGIAVKRPGKLTFALIREALVGEAGANLVDVEHVREGLDLHVRETAVQLVLETRGRDNAADVLARVGDAGYEARVVR